MKQFSCPTCGCKRFTLVHRIYTDVDFSIEGHLSTSGVGQKFDSFLCYECGAEVPTELAEEMLKEVENAREKQS